MKTVRDVYAKVDRTVRLTVSPVAILTALATKRLNVRAQTTNVQIEM